MLDTVRLRLLPLTHNQLLKFIRDDHSLESELQLKPSKGNISPSLQHALESSILPNVSNKDRDYLYHTLWIIISKENNRIAGDICFVGEPDPEGEIEIGYGIYPEFRARGYMTEAVAGIIEWAKTQEKIKSIFAATAKENIASYSILEKNNFVHIGEVDDMLSWKLILK
ncbi:GNAT family N-acetyltransferase [Pedobacter sp. AW1-32]|uniref:GNAT family N-acetyltransferase n=1 Tax=Pedobacter sp. AW1-32 TaxID=3383026 RepID=UPI003FEE4FE9